MHEILAQLIEGVPFSGDIQQDMQAFLEFHGCPKTALHCRQVAAQAKQLAARFAADEASAEVAGWLHDISAATPTGRRAVIARSLNLPVLPEEEAFPMLLHQKLSAVIARELFGVTDVAALSAIGCHTTLKADASLLDKVVFVADKIAWDQPGEPPYLKEMLAALEHSLDRAALCYLDYLWQRRVQLPGPFHPWALAALNQLKILA